MRGLRRCGSRAWNQRMPLSPLTAFRKRAVFSSGIGMGPGVALRCGRFGRGFFGRLAALSVAGFMVRFLMAENSIVSIDPLWAIRLKIRNYSGAYDRGCFLYVFCGHAHRLQLVRHACERLSKSAEIWRRNHLAHDTGTDAAHRPRAATWCAGAAIVRPCFYPPSMRGMKNTSQPGRSTCEYTSSWITPRSPPAPSAATSSQE